MSFVTKFQSEDALWHSRLLGWVYVALSINLITGDSIKDAGCIRGSILGKLGFSVALPLH
jgi:hypothetical protein